MATRTENIKIDFTGRLRQCEMPSCGFHHPLVWFNSYASSSLLYLLDLTMHYSKIQIEQNLDPQN